MSCPNPVRLLSAVLAAAWALSGCGGGDGGGPTSPPPPPALGDILLAITTTGVDPDFDGYQVVVDGTPRSFVTPNSETTIRGRGAGDHQILLQDVSSNCELGGGNPRSVLVSAGSTTRVDIAIACTAIPPLLNAIVFSDGLDIYSMSSSGGSPTKLTSANVNSTMPDVSPDGKRIAFMRRESASQPGTSGDDNDNFLYVMLSDGSDEWRLPVAGTDPAWSPDGARIAFWSLYVENPEITVVDIDGRNRVRITDSLLPDWHPSWSPDGSKIVFHSFRNRQVATGNRGDLYVINADGTGTQQLTFTDREAHIPDAGRPSYSPDGTRLLFTSLRDHTSPDANAPSEVYVMNADGSGPVNLTNNPAWDGGAEWSPDGARIVFSSGRDADEFDKDIWVMNADGSNPQRLTTEGNRVTPTFSPTAASLSAWKARWGHRE